MPNHALVINVDIAETRVALLEEGNLTELFIEREAERSPVGNVYLGKVTRVLPGMQAAFIDVGLDRAAFLHVEDVVVEEGMEDLLDSDDSEEEAEDTTEEGASAKKPRTRKVSRSTPIRDVLKEGQPLMVQVSKGPIGTKGARVTSHVALPGRYVVYLPTVDQSASPSASATTRNAHGLRESIEAVKPPQGGFIVRTVASGLTRSSSSRTSATSCANGSRSLATVAP